MIILSKDKIDERYNIDDNGVITDLQGNVQKTFISAGREYFHGYYFHQILMWTKYGYRDTKTWAIHHKDENKLNNKLNNLEFKTHSEHLRLHRVGKKFHLSEEAKKKMSEAKKGIHLSLNTKNKLSIKFKGKHWIFDHETGKRKWILN